MGAVVRGDLANLTRTVLQRLGPEQPAGMSLASPLLNSCGDGTAVKLLEGAA